MKSKHSIKMTALALVFVFVTAGKIEAQGQPQAGSIVYNGDVTFGAVTVWSSLWMSRPNVGVELDIAHHTASTWAIRSCTTFSNLPNWYDDCMTAGILDGAYYTMGVGSYHTEAIAPLLPYYSDWYINLYEGRPQNDRLSFHWQEVHHYFCPFDWQWCMNGTGFSYRLISHITATWGTPVTYWW